MSPNEIAREVVDTAMQVHMRLGSGLLESVYLAVMVHELGRRGIHAAREVPVSVRWDDITLEVGFRADMIVEDAVVELKSVEKVLPVHKKQLLTYLRLADKRLGLLINFGEEMLVNGISRVANGLQE
jgi:GxxExxY protein